MKKFSKKLMALAMAGVMLCSPLTAAAAMGTGNETDDRAVALTGGSSTGTGELEGWVDSEVFIVVLPTEDVDDSTYNFKLDPQHLLNKTQSDSYPDADATVWFGTNPGTSGALTAKSKSNIPVELSVSATVDGLKGESSEIVMTDDDTFADDTSTSLYMGVNLDGATAAIAAGKTEAKASATLEAVAEDKFEFKYDAGSSPKYTYEFIGSDTDAMQADFALKAACNDNADWGAVAADTIAPKVTVAWSMKPYVETPETDGTTALTFNYTGAKPANATITFNTPSGAAWKPQAGQYTNGNITIGDSTITLNPGFFQAVVTTYGYGNYSFTVNGTVFEFIITNVPKTDGTTELVFNYTGTKPANATITFNTPKGTWTPQAGQYTNGNIVIGESTITLKPAFFQAISGTYGYGDFSFVVNGVTYKFKIVQ